MLPGGEGAVEEGVGWAPSRKFALLAGCEGAVEEGAVVLLGCVGTAGWRTRRRRCRGILVVIGVAREPGGDRAGAWAIVRVDLVATCLRCDQFILFSCGCRDCRG